MSEKKEKIFEHEGKAYKVVEPSPDLISKADRLRSKVFSEELKEGTLLRGQLETELRNRELWTDQMQMQYNTLQSEVSDLEYTLARGGISLSKAKAIAMDMRHKRQQMVSLLSGRTELDSNTCEGKADAARFNFLFANCLVYEDSGEKYFANGLDDYLKNQNDPVATKAATEFFYLISNTEDADSTLPENKFLKKYRLADDQGRLVDSDGRLVDSEGRHIDEEGYYIKWQEDGTSVKVDIHGRKLKGDSFDVEELPFLDDDGNPIIVEDEVEKKKTTKRTRKKTESVAE